MSLRWLPVFALFGLVGCGGSTDDERPPSPPPAQSALDGECRPIEPLSDYPDPGSSFIDCDALDGYEIFLLNDFETLHRPDWYFNNDRTADQEPKPDAQGVPTTVIPGGRCVGAPRSANAATLCASPDVPRGQCSEPMPESRGALRVASGLLTNNGGVFGWISQKLCAPEDWTVGEVRALEGGPELPPDEYLPPHVNDSNQPEPSSNGLTLAEACEQVPGPPEVGPCSVGEPPSPPRLGCQPLYDTSDWDGVVFWGRVAPGSETTLRVRASDYLTDDKGCACNPYTSQNDSSDGCDKFGIFVPPLTGDFEVRLAPFEEMQQGGWGKPSPGLYVKRLYEVGVEYGRGSWDLWVDDVGFYRRRR